MILKVLGATRARLVVAFLCEFGLIGLATAAFGVVAGSFAALAVVHFVMKLDFVWLWPQALAAALGALAVAVLLGLVGTFRILGRQTGPIFTKSLGSAGLYRVGAPLCAVRSDAILAATLHLCFTRSWLRMERSQRVHNGGRNFASGPALYYPIAPV